MMMSESDSSLDPLADYTPVALAPRHDGWTAERQRRFLTILADTGQVSLAARAVGVSPRSAYRLRHHPKGREFRIMWDKALYLATDRLAALAFERAIEGTPHQIWKNGELVAETRKPSDRLLIFLLRRLQARTFGVQSSDRAMWDDRDAHARRTLPRELDMPTCEVDLAIDDGVDLLTP